VNDIERAARVVRDASAILVAAGAGMGVDSGLPDFRGDHGFWRAYPPYQKLGLSFSDLANPRWFDTDPAFAWGFYGHRLALYRATTPHGGFAILQKWIAKRPNGGFVFTSNVDGQFQRAGFDPNAILECHGAIDYLQCTRDCGVGIISANDYQPEVDEETFRARGELPKCPRCKALLRPNVLMFGDYGWDSAREDEQSRRFEKWLATISGKLAIIECGAGTGVPTVRMTSERLVRALGASLIRINVREPQVPTGQIGLSMGALEALSAIDAV
jgi:NAD-dependent SIR2 family protein deacetylase